MSVVWNMGLRQDVTGLTYTRAQTHTKSINRFLYSNVSWWLMTIWCNVDTPPTSQTTHAHIHAYTHVHTHTTHTHSHTCMHTHMHTRAHIHRQTPTPHMALTHTHTHACIHTCIHAHTYAHRQSPTPHTWRIYRRHMSPILACNCDFVRTL